MTGSTDSARTLSLSEIASALRKKLDGVTRGPWEQGGGAARGRADCVYSDDATGSAVASTSFSYVPRLVAEVNANAAFIAACDPGTIRELLNERDALRSQADIYRDALLAIRGAHVPDQPASSQADETTWVMQHVGSIRKIAADALDRVSQDEAR